MIQKHYISTLINNNAQRQAKIKIMKVAITIVVTFIVLAIVAVNTVQPTTPTDARTAKGFGITVKF